jgi:hypothetical protein
MVQAMAQKVLMEESDTKPIQYRKPTDKTSFSPRTERW